MISFLVHGDPIAQPRQRHSRSGRNYIPADHAVHGYKTAVAVAAREVFKDEPLDGCLVLKLVFVFARPKAMYAKKYPRGRIWRQSVPDLDNLAKSVKDALKNITWFDDSQVCHLEAYKFYANIEGGAEDPSTSVVIDHVEAS